jgi:hypothetical protein
MPRGRRVWIVCALVAAFAAVAAAAPASGQQPSDREQAIREMQALAWQRGPTEGRLGTTAIVKVRRGRRGGRSDSRVRPQVLPPKLIRSVRRSTHLGLHDLGGRLYLSDAARLLRWRELLLVEAGRGRLRPSLSENPFTIAGRVLAFPPLVLPHRSVFIGSWGGQWSADRDVTSALASLERRRGSLTAVRIAAAVGFALLFIAGPALTFLWGPGAAVLLTAALLYPTILGTAVVLWRRRRDVHLTAMQTVGLGIELLVCPAFLPNLVRKITTRHRVEADGAQIVAVSRRTERAGDAARAFRTGAGCTSRSTCSRSLRSPAPSSRRSGRRGS